MKTFLFQGDSITDAINKLSTAVKHTLFHAIINNRKELQIMKNNILSYEF